MVHKARNGFLSDILLGLATALLVVGVLFVPNVVVADDEPPPATAKVACTNCTGGCSGASATNGCSIASYHCNPAAGTSGCATSTGPCGCDKNTTTGNCDCYK